MKVAAIYDIHGNLPALEAVLADIDRSACDLILVGGDVASGPMPREAVGRLMSLGPRARFVRGNGDREVVTRFDALNTAGEPSSVAADEDVAEVVNAWTARQIDRAAGLPGSLLRSDHALDRRPGDDVVLPRLAARRRGNPDACHT